MFRSAIFEPVCRAFVVPEHAVCADALRIDQSAETMRVDGALREWKGARFTSLGTARTRLCASRWRAKARDCIWPRGSRRQARAQGGAGAGQDALVLSLFAPSDKEPARARLAARGSVGREKALAALRVGKGSLASAAEIRS